MTAEQRRATILAAARTEFSRHGYHGVSTASIASAAACSEPMIYKHFSGKQQLFVACMTDTVDRYRVTYSTFESSPGADALDAAQEFVSAVMQDPDFMQMMQLRMLAAKLSDDPEIRTAIVTIEQSTDDLIAAANVEARASGLVRDDVPVSYISATWLGLMCAACHREALEPGGFASMIPHVHRFFEDLRAR